MPEIRWRRVLPGEEHQLAMVRQWLASLLPACPARGDLALVATELGSNAIRHTASGRGGQFAVEVNWHPAVVRVAVTDGGAPDGPRVIDDPLSEHGRGLRMVRELSARTGVAGDHRGRQVWADITWGDAAAADAASPRPGREAITAGLDYLASRFAGVPAWFGYATLQWWALTDQDGLVTAPSAQDLAGLLSQLQAPQRPPHAGSAAARSTGRPLPGQRESRNQPPARSGSTAA